MNFQNNIVALSLPTHVGALKDNNREAVRILLLAKPQNP